MTALTSGVGSNLASNDKSHYDRLLEEAGTGSNVEHVLDRVRLCRELIGASPDYEVGGLKGDSATKLDRAICREIFTLVSGDPPKGIVPHVKFANWVRFIRRDWPIEVFTTNYDLLIERGLEATETPHFDGFVGSVAPYFSGVTVEADGGRLYEAVYPPRSWVRVWKLHGSIGWRPSEDPTTKMRRIIRTHGTAPTTDDDVLIFPSREKYADSRKLPFVAYHDRLRRLLSSGETLLVVVGYSFGDEHINEIMFEALRNNPRLAVAALIHGPLASLSPHGVVELAKSMRSLSLYGPDQACIGGILGQWDVPSKPPTPPLARWPFWDDGHKSFTLGDFWAFTEFLSVLFGTPGGSATPSSPTAPVAPPP